ncbi:MAG: 50S ribosomal protein L29 [Candidatus Omnitrophica bacterium]|nr:50S ribosomal protein L29 [Candidatus Omnitrophota bacterium]
MAQAKELRAVPAVELSQRLTEARKTLTLLRLKARQGALEQPHQIRQLRRDIARLLTVLTEEKGTHVSP